MNGDLLVLFNLVIVLATILALIFVVIDQFYFKPHDYDGGYLVSISYASLPILLLVVLIRSYLFEPFSIPSESMYSGLTNGDLIAVTKASYDIKLPLSNQSIYEVSDPKRGDVAVFKFPLDPNTNYVKRVIGLPNDHLVWDGDDLFINGDKVKREIVINPKGRFANRTSIESLGGKNYTIRQLSDDDSSQFHKNSTYLIAKNNKLNKSSNPLDSSINYLEIKIPENYYFMMGDNRDESSDSRDWGLVHRDDFIGRADYLVLHIDPQKPIWKFWEKFSLNRSGFIN